MIYSKFKRLKKCRICIVNLVALSEKVERKQRVDLSNTLNMLIYSLLTTVRLPLPAWNTQDGSGQMWHADTNGTRYT